MNYKALKLVAKKRIIFAKYKDKYHPAVKAANIRASREIKHAKFSFEKKLAAEIKNDTKSFYAYARSKTKSKARVGFLTDDHGHALETAAENSEHFNTYFTSVFTAENVDNSPEPEQIFKFPDEYRLGDMEITMASIEAVIQKLRQGDGCRRLVSQVFVPHKGRDLLSALHYLKQNTG